jgi:hypothetical protein
MLTLIMLWLFRWTFFSCQSVRFFLGVSDISFFVSWRSSGICCYSSQRLCPIFSFSVLGSPWNGSAPGCIHRLMVDLSSVAADESLVHHLEAELDEKKRTSALIWRDLGLC